MIIQKIKDVLKGKCEIKDKRSAKWPTVRKKFLIENPKCAVCNGKKILEVHHIKPFNSSPELELDPSNLITLCESKKKGLTCHLLIGHLGNYRNINKDVINDSLVWNKKLNTSISKHN
jgi:5-methylcytosine-specific restriction protein A